MSASPTRGRWDGLRTLRVQVSVALVVAAAVCAVVANKSSGGELAGAYRDAGHGVLTTAGAQFSSSFNPEDLKRGRRLRRDVAALRELHPELVWAAVYAKGQGTPLARSGASPEGARRAAAGAGAARAGATRTGELRTGDLHLATLASPLRNGAGVPVGSLELGFDLGPSDAALSDRNKRILLILAALLSGFALFSATLLERGIFRPLNRLRGATNQIRSGDLATRLRWRRGDELGTLARDFDAMAAAIETGHQKLESLALEDPLTGLSNHRHFQEALARELAAGDRENKPVALVIVDIDNFKRINDARGHPYGDQILRAVGERIRDAMSGIGSAARLGGDEFGIVLPGMRPEQAFALCEAARASVSAFSPSDFDLSCSAGVACFPTDARRADDLVQLADGALYWAKQSGRACTRMFDPEHVLVVTEEQREAFSTLLEQPSAIRPVFQPLVRLSTGDTAGYEALARFADKRNLPPSWWFAQAHRFGLGASLEAEAIRLALAEPGRPEGAFLSVNVSPSALRSQDVAAVLPEDLRGVVLEITETEEILEQDGLQQVLAPLRARGARVAVDDAGAGYAGLQQVMAMQADIIKLDRALISGVSFDRAKSALVRSLVHFAAETGAELCAEGIETLEELHTLADLGVTLGQGYVLARPGPAWAGVTQEAWQECRRAASAGSAGARPLRGVARRRST